MPKKQGEKRRTEKRRKVKEMKENNIFMEDRVCFSGRKEKKEREKKEKRNYGKEKNNAIYAPVWPSLVTCFPGSWKYGTGLSRNAFRYDKVRLERKGHLSVSYS